METIDLREYQFLKKVVKDCIQCVQTPRKVIIKEICFSAHSGVFSTTDKFKAEKVSLGWDTWVTMNDGTEIKFHDSIMKTADRIDERNLVYCKYLNLRSSSIINLDTKHLGNL